MTNEAKGSKGGNAIIINLQTTSTTAAFTEGNIVAIDGDGYAEMCATADSTLAIGIAANGLPTLTSARQRQLAVQTTGMIVVDACADSTSGHTSAIVPGDLVACGVDSDASYTGQCVVNAESTSTRAIGIALEPLAASSGVSAIKVLLTGRA